MRLTESGKTFVSRTIWIYVAMFAVESLVFRHRETLMFWTCCGSFALLFPMAIYYTTRRMIGRL